MCSQPVVKLLKATQILMIVDCVREVTVEKLFVKYGLFEHLLFLLCQVERIVPAAVPGDRQTAANRKVRPLYTYTLLKPNCESLSVWEMEHDSGKIQSLCHENGSWLWEDSVVP